MKDKQIEKILDDLLDQEIPEGNADKKEAAISLAIDEFNQQYSADSEKSENKLQGNETPTRPKDTYKQVANKGSQSFWSFLMNFTNNRAAYGAFATFAAAFVALSVFLMMPQMQPTDHVVKVDEATPSSRVQPLDDKVLIESITEASEEEVVVTATKYTEVAPQVIIDSNVANTPPRARADRPDAIAQRPDLTRQAYTQKREKESLQAKSRVSADQSVGLPQPMVVSESHQAYDIVYPDTRPNDREEYAEYETNPIYQVSDDPVSTFSIDVDTASYSLIRNQLNSGYLPKPEMVRAEELINYFSYDYPRPRNQNTPFSTNVNVFESPWNKERKLVHIGIQGYELETNDIPDSNLVFLLDVSGSMNQPNKLPLVKQSMGLLLDTLKPTDTVSIVVYAGAAGMVLEPTEVKDKAKIQAALQRLSAGGSTAGGAGIDLAYQLAEQHFKKEGVNRIILATDGDFNVGMQSNDDLKTLVERKRENGVFLSILGFGRNNYQDDMMQTLAQNGNGVAAYIDTLSEAKKVLVDEATSTLFSIAKDVKIQVEFNPNTVSEYRLVGYETRHLNREDFNNDKVDAGDIGAGHSVTAIYEITPATANNKAIDKPRYAANNKSSAKPTDNAEYGFLKVRYKLPDETKSKLIEQPIARKTAKPDQDARFSIAVAGFAQLLSDSKYLNDYDFDTVIEQASASKGDDPYGYRSEFIQLARMAKIAQP